MKLDFDEVLSQLARYCIEMAIPRLETAVKSLEQHDEFDQSDVARLNTGYLVLLSYACYAKLPKKEILGLTRKFFYDTEPLNSKFGYELLESQLKKWRRIKLNGKLERIIEKTINLANIKFNVKRKTKPKKPTLIYLEPNKKDDDVNEENPNQDLSIALKDAAKDFYKIHSFNPDFEYERERIENLVGVEGDRFYRMSENDLFSVDEVFYVKGQQKLDLPLKPITSRLIAVPRRIVHEVTDFRDMFPPPNPNGQYFNLKPYVSDKRRSQRYRGLSMGDIASLFGYEPSEVMEVLKKSREDGLRIGKLITRSTALDLRGGSFYLIRARWSSGYAALYDSDRSLGVIMATLRAEGIKDEFIEDDSKSILDEIETNKKRTLLMRKAMNGRELKEALPIAARTVYMIE